MRLTPGSLAAGAFGANEIAAEFRCTNELNRRFQPLFENSDLRVVGIGDEGEARVVELAGGRFFLATLFLPQVAALDDAPSPVIDSYVRAAASR